MHGCALWYLGLGLLNHRTDLEGCCPLRKEQVRWSHILYRVVDESYGNIPVPWYLELSLLQPMV